MPETLAQDTEQDLAELNAMLDRAEADESAGATIPNPESLTPPEEQAGQSTAESQGEVPNNETESKPDKTETEQDKRSKFAKEQERREKSWAKLNAEKEAFKKEQEALQRERDQIRSRQAEIEKKSTEEAKPRYTAEQYDTAAEKFDEEGKYELADLARQEAKRLRDTGENDRVKKSQMATQFKTQLMNSWTKAKSDFPTILTEGTEENKALVEFLKAEPDALKHPNGPYLAASYVTFRLKAAKAEAMSKELDSLKSKIKEYEQRLQIPGSGNPASIPGEKSFEEMTASEQERELQRMLNE